MRCTEPRARGPISMTMQHNHFAVAAQFLLRTHKSRHWIGRTGLRRSTLLSKKKKWIWFGTPDQSLSETIPPRLQAIMRLGRTMSCPQEARRGFEAGLA